MYLQNGFCFEAGGVAWFRAATEAALSDQIRLFWDKPYGHAYDAIMYLFNQKLLGAQKAMREKLNQDLWPAEGNTFGTGKPDIAITDKAMYEQVTGERFPYRTGYSRNGR